MLSCFDVADYFLAQQDEDSGDTISNLKLQKLVYYAQGLHLAMYGKPLFAEQIEAWTHGPVVPALYHKYKGSGSGNLPPPDDFDLQKYDKETKEFLDEVYDVFGQFSGWKLRNMTHAEPPWAKADKPGVISHESMKAYFKTLLKK